VRKRSTPSITAAVRNEGKISNACCAPIISAYSTGDSDTACRRSTNSRASSTGASVSRLPWMTRNGGASARTRSIGDALENASGSSSNRFFMMIGPKNRLTVSFCHVPRRLVKSYTP
jgi:hypothetical protein